MRNLIIKTCIIGSSFILLNSCKDYLQETPYSFIAPENFFKSASDAEYALTGLYDILNTSSIQGQGNHHLWGRGMHYLTVLGSDELVANNTSPDVNFTAYSNYTYTPATDVASYTWIFLYAGINRANYILDKVPSIEMDEVRRTEILAEAHFMRGFLYFYAGFMWGGVPITTSSVPELFETRRTLQEVMQLCEQDFSFAFDNLPNRNIKPGRANKYSAAAFLAKMYLYLGSSKKHQVGRNVPEPLNSFDWVDEEDALSNATQYCEEVYRNSGYKLIDEYRYLFLAATEAEAREEHLFLVQAGPGGSSEFILASSLSGPSGNAALYGGSYGRIRPVVELYDKYNANDGRRTHNMVGSLSSATTSEVINGIKYFIPTALQTASFLNYNLGKYREADPLSKTSRGVPNWAGETDFGIIRFADIVLMYAELKYYDGDEPGARELIREVRNRAVKNDVQRLNLITTAYLKADFMDELMDERSRELCGEGWRRFDLIRTNRLESVVAGLQSTRGTMNIQNVPEIKANYNDYKIWYPIPAREIELNPGLEQNYGYPK